MSNVVILLTACINPGGMFFTTLQDTDIRRKQYIESVSHYLEHTKYNIVLCNNSGFDKELFETFNGGNSRLEFLFFSGNDYDKSYGKGYGEYEIIRYALSNSVLLSNADFIIKITGRYIISNLVQSIRLNNIIILKKDVLYYNTELSRYSWCDSRCFYASRVFFKQFLFVQNNINDYDKFCFENKLYKMIQQSEVEPFPFLLPLIVIGMSGSSGEYYDFSSSIQNRAMTFFYNCEILKSQLPVSPIKIRISVVEFAAKFYWYLKKLSRIIKSTIRRISSVVRTAK